jgi:hypothetical protein
MKCFFVYHNSLFTKINRFIYSLLDTFDKIKRGFFNDTEIKIKQDTFIFYK